jgi:hypothetical protein
MAIKIITAVAAAAGAILVPLVSPARDTTNLAQTLSADVQEWVRGLRGANNISCCDNADGIDPEWEAHGDGYRVRFKGEWLRVEPDALLNIPNKMGVARAWIGYTADGKPFVRCFIAGPTI